LTVSKWFAGDGSKESIIDVPEGQLYVVRPLSLKGYSELIYKDAGASIRRTGAEFQYQLVITRVYEEGEQELLEDDVDAELEGLNKDEQSFLLDEALKFRVDIRESGEKVFAWRDLSGGSGDLWEFVCDSSTPKDTVEAFELIAVRCQYERKYKKSAEKATSEDLEQFVFEDEMIPAASPILQTKDSEIPTVSSTTVNTAPAKAKTPEKTDAKTAAVNPLDHGKSLEIYTRESAELHLFDFESGTFVLQDQVVESVVMDLGNWNYWIKITGQNSKSWVGRPVEDDMNPVFNFEYLSAIFNVYGTDNSAYSWLMRFKDNTHLENFQQGLMQALWEHNNQVKWAKLKSNDQDYVLEAFQDLTMEDAEDIPEEEEESEEEPEPRARHRSEEYDSDESNEDESAQPKDKDGQVNSQLAVGFKNDRAFVVRGSKIGVFKSRPDNQLEFVTNISKVATPKGKLFSPKKVMLHGGDKTMVLQNADNPNSVFHMDLETGKIVDEWKVHDDIPINTFAPKDVSLSMQ
jgi:VID27 N-terminal region/VID27 C-terminal WD40-like domain/VID27 PH-like domain